ncbi:MAG: tetratricopeptide repeat protein, partial [Pseudomonadota bacterium]
EALLGNANDEMKATPELETAQAQLGLAKQAASAGPLAELEAAVEADGDNHQARYDLAIAMHAAGNAEGAIEHLLELFRRDREWNEGAAKAQLFTVFDALKPEDPLVLTGRRRLSSMIFA